MLDSLLGGRLGPVQVWLAAKGVGDRMYTGGDPGGPCTWYT